jgi:sensor histidine kinase YesM
MNSFVKNQAVRRIGLHIGFWIGLWTLPLAGQLESTWKELLNEMAVYAYVVLTYATVTYANNYGLVPRLLRRQRYVAYAAAVIGLILSIAWLNDVLLGWWVGTKPNVLSRAITLLGFTVFTAALKLLRDSSRVQLKLSNLERIHAEQELQLLKSQVNPHFLFNTLNGIYALALSDSNRTADTVLKLAELLQYMVSTAPLRSVELQKEITYLENYLNLEKIRLDPGAVITFRGQGDFSGVSIAPMLLLPFVENAFKHGVETQVQNVWVEIDASLQGDELFFQVVNTKPAGYKPSGKSANQTGLANVNKRLRLLYPNRHELTLAETDSKYTAQLWLKL